MEDMNSLVADAEAVIRSKLSAGEEFAFFGHSFGCDIIFELISRAEHSFWRLPVWIFLLGNTPPFSQKLRMRAAHLPDEEFVKAMEFFGGIDERLYLFPDILKYFCKIMRADMRIVEAYEDNVHLKPEQPWETDIIVFCGRDDKTFDHALLEDWKICTARSCTICFFDGGHFFVDDNAAAIAHIINEALGSCEERNTVNG